MAQPLPKKLEDALQSQSKYKQTYSTPESVLSSILNDQNCAPLADYSFEKSLLDNLVGGAGKSKNDLFSSQDEKRTGGGGGDSLFPKRYQRRIDESERLKQFLKSEVVINENPIETNETRIREEDMMVNMTNRLSQLERVTRELRQELVAKEKDVLRLRRRNEILESTIGKSIQNNENAYDDDDDDQKTTLSNMKQKLETATKSARNAVDETMLIKSENIKLQLRIKEMETFLLDYGLTWKGSNHSQNDGKECSGVGAHDSNLLASSKNFENDKPIDENAMPDIDLLLSKVEELNSLVSNGPRLVMEGNRAKYEFDAEKIKVILFGDAMSVDGKDPEKYSEESVQSFLRDVTDGYFPLEFKDAYPDGVFIQCVDKRNELTLSQSFQGIGNVLGRKGSSLLTEIGGKEFTPSLSTTRSPPRHNRRPRSSDSSEGIGLQELYRRMPSDVKITTRGQVVNMRDEIAKKLSLDSFDGQDKTCSTSMPNCEAEKEEKLLRECNQTKITDVSIVKTRKVKEEEVVDDDGVDDEMTTLRIRSSEGKPILLRMPIQNTVAQLHREVALQTKLKETQFELRSSFPNKSYEVEAATSVTLEQAGLVPSAVLIVRLI